MGLYGGLPRPPLIALNIEERKSIYNALKEFGEEYPDHKIDLLKP